MSKANTFPDCGTKNFLFTTDERTKISLSIRQFDWQMLRLYFVLPSIRSKKLFVPGSGKLFLLLKWTVDHFDSVIQPARQYRVYALVPRFFETEPEAYRLGK